MTQIQSLLAFSSVLLLTFFFSIVITSCLKLEVGYETVPEHLAGMSLTARRRQ